MASSYAMTSECADKLRDLQEILLDLHYSTHDQDIFGVSLSLKSISKSAKLISLGCGEDSINIEGKEEYGWIQGCQEGFEFLRDITSEIGSLEDSLLAVKELERFYPVFKGTCLYADDYLLVEDLCFNDYDVDCEKRNVKGMIQELLDDEEALTREAFLHVN